MPVKHLLSTLLLFSIPLTVFAEPPSQWHFLGKQKINGISGISGIDAEHFLVVHDQKKPNEPRLSIVTWKKAEQPFLTHLDWCNTDAFPVDLEAITAIPNHYKEYLLLESKGKVTRIQLEENNACKVTAQFDLPTATSASNMEGLALHCFEENCLLVWAERGDDKIPAKMSWAGFDIKENQLQTPEAQPVEFNAPFPQLNRRSISDLAIDGSGKVWVAASSESSDDGPFQSAIYHLGTFTQHDNQIEWSAANEITPLVRYEHDNVKVEGLFATANGLIVGTEDENLGGKITFKLLK
jgi:hypothetical protein